MDQVGKRNRNTGPAVAAALLAVSIFQLADAGQSPAAETSSAESGVQEAVAETAAPEETTTSSASATSRAAEAVERGDWIWPPYVEGYLGVEVFYDGIFESGDTTNDLFTETKLGGTVFMRRELFVEFAASLAPATAPDPGQTAIFDDHGVAIGLLALTWDRDTYWISGGKGRANFSIAQSIAPGIWGSDIANDNIKVAGRWGVAGNYGFDLGQFGDHAFEASTFFADTTVLGQRFGSSRGQLKRSDGGPSNTESPESFALALDGTNIAAAPGLRYHLAGLRQKVDRLNDATGQPLPSSAVSDEWRIAAALVWNNLILSENASVTPIVEFVHFWNARGLENRSENYATAGAEFFLGQWSLALASTYWNIDNPGASGVDNVLVNVSGGYLFESGFGIDLGYRYLDEDNQTSNTIGVALSYDLRFAF